MAGLGTMPDAGSVAAMVLAVTDESPSDLRIVGRGVSTEGWRVETDGCTYCVLVAIPHEEYEARFLNARPQMEARAVVTRALWSRDQRCPVPIATNRSAGVPEGLQRWSWLMTSWVEGTPWDGASEVVAREMGALLRALHAIPSTGYGLVVDEPQDEEATEIRGEAEEPLAGFASRWGAALWPFDGRPLVGHPVARVAPQLALQAGMLREQLLKYAEVSARAVCHLDLNGAHIMVGEGHLVGLLDFGDAAVVPPAFDIASFAYFAGWETTEHLLAGYASNSVIRDIRRVEAQQLGVVLALKKIEKVLTVRPDEERLQRAIGFLEATLPLAMRRTDA